MAEEKEMKEEKKTEAAQTQPAETKKEPEKKEEAKTEQEKPKEEIILKRSYIIPLDKAYDKPKTARNKRAMKIIREFAARHMKTSDEKVKISVKISEKVNEQGMRKPPKKIKVTLTKNKEGTVKCDLE